MRWLHRPSFRATLAIAMACSTACAPHAAQMHSPHVSELRAKLVRGAATEFLVEIDDSAVKRSAELFNAARGVAFDDEATLRLKADRYAELKRQVLARVPSRDIEVLRDYELMPLMLLRARAASAFDAVAAHPLVRTVHENRQESILPGKPR